MAEALLRLVAVVGDDDDGPVLARARVGRASRGILARLHRGQNLAEIFVSALDSLLVLVESAPYMCPFSSTWTR